MSETPETTSYPVATRVNIGLNRVEDRLILAVATRQNDERACLVTRRALGLLLRRYADFMASTSPWASQAAPEQRDSVLQMEHLKAVSDGADGNENGDAESPAEGGGEASGQTTWTVTGPFYLVTDVRFERKGESIVLALDGVRRRRDGPDGRKKEPVLAFVLTRRDAHKLLALLREKGSEAGWALPEPSAWTGEVAATPAGPMH